MASAAIDLDILNELFDNQKRLDDIFNGDFFLDSKILVDDHASETSVLKDNPSLHFNKDTSFNSENKDFLKDSRRIVKILVPVILEVAAISYCIIQFN